MRGRLCVEKDNITNMLGYTKEQYAVYKKNAWIVLVAFSVLYCFLYCGRLNQGLAISAMEAQTDWTKQDLGILSAIFFWTYGMGHLFNGRLGEIFGLNRFIVSGVILSAVANVLISFQSSLIIIAICWGFNGYFQSMLWSPGIALISNWWPGDRRGFATGFANAFSGFGQVAATLSVVAAFAIAPDMGWRSAFVFPIIMMVVIVVFYSFLVKDRPSKKGLPEYVDKDKDRNNQDEEMARVVAQKGKLYPYVHLLKQWRFDIWLLIIAGSSIARYGLLTWMPSYFVDTFGVNPKDGILGSVFLPLGMAFGTFIIPIVTDKYCPNNRLPAVLACSIIAGATVFGFMRVEPGMTLNILLFVAGFFIYAINGVVWAYATDVGGRVFAGTAAGILDCAAYLGASVQAVYFGSVLTATGNWNLVFTVVILTCITIAVCAVIAGIGVNKKD